MVVSGTLASFAKAANQPRLSQMQNAPNPETPHADETVGDPVGPMDLAARLAGRLCHDFISPTSAIVSALDLIEDPEQQDMREEAMAVITTSARKLASLLTFARAAFGGAAATESFDVRELERLTRDLYEHARAELDWAVEPASLPKPAARALLNLAQLGITALPMGGVARLCVTDPQGGELAMSLDARGARARLRPEAVQGLRGQAFDEGMAGQWVQAYFLYALAAQAGGRLELAIEDEAVRIDAHMPAGPSTE